MPELQSVNQGRRDDALGPWDAGTLRPGGYLLHLPVRPAPASTFLEILFRFKTHPPAEVEAATTRYFQIISRHRFPPLDIIGWTKIAILAQKP